MTSEDELAARTWTDDPRGAAPQQGNAAAPAGLDRNCSQVIVFNIFQRATGTMTDLYQIVKEVAGNGE